MSEATNQIESNVQPLDVPRYWGTSLSVLGSTSEAVILFGSTAAAIGPDSTPVGGTAATVQVSMPVVTAKELIALLTDFVENVEREVGSLDSPYLKTRRTA